MATKLIELRELFPGEYFFFTTEEESTERLEKLDEIDELLDALGLPTTSTAVRALRMAATASAYVIDAYAPKVKAYFTTQLATGKRHMWSDPSLVVQWSQDRETLDSRLAEMKKERKAMEEELLGLRRARGKKQKAGTEIVERTIRTGA